MFEEARSEAANDTDLIPYWIYEGSVRVERRVPTLPFSREVMRLAWLKRSLTVYRLAFGQPRQDDLLEYLQGLWALAWKPAIWPIYKSGLSRVHSVVQLLHLQTRLNDLTAFLMNAATATRRLCPVLV